MQAVKKLKDKAENKHLLNVFASYLNGVAPLLNFTCHLIFNGA